MFINNYEINKSLEKYFKESAELVWDEYFSFKYFLIFDFAREISSKWSDSSGRSGHEWVNPLMSGILIENVHHLYIWYL